MQAINPLFQTDFYKVSHYRMYPNGTVEIYSNMTARKSRIEGIDKIVFFGLQYFLKEYLQKQWHEGFFNRPKQEVVEEYQKFMDNTLGPGVTTEHIAALHDLQYLPLEIKALPEGSEVDIRIPFLTIRNTVDHAYWLVNYLESIISNILWKPITSATIARQYRKILDQYAKETSDNPEFVQWQGHDFHMRGADGLESTSLTGAGHLLSFTGTDTIPAIKFLENYYHGDVQKELIGASVPATEHSVMCMGTKDDEIGTFEALMDKYPSGILSVVSDTWDLWKVLTEYLPQLKEKVLARNGKLVIRPDSGDPVRILCGYLDYELAILENGEMVHIENPETLGFGKTISAWERKGVIELLWEVFGGIVNSKGFKELDSHIGAIYGDSITMERAREICERLKAKGFASTNVVLGIGSFTYQYTTRDTFGMAVKATHGKVATWSDDCFEQKKCLENELIGDDTDICKDGCVQSVPVIESRAIWKDPVTDDGTKKSAKGYLKVVSVGDINPINNRFTHGHYMLMDNVSEEEEKEGELETVFLDGQITKETSIYIIRERLKKFGN